MTDQQPDQPKDYAPPMQEGVVELGHGVVEKLGKPRPELLWILLIVIVFQLSEGWRQMQEKEESGMRSQAIVGFIESTFAHVAEIEKDRASEHRELTGMIRELCSKQMSGS